MSNINILINTINYFIQNNFFLFHFKKIQFTNIALPYDARASQIASKNLLCKRKCCARPASWSGAFVRNSGKLKAMPPAERERSAIKGNFKGVSAHNNKERERGLMRLTLFSHWNCLSSSIQTLCVCIKFETIQGHWELYDPSTE